MKKFNEKDVFLNTLKTYPKVKIFSSNGKFYYKSVNIRENGPVVNDFLLPHEIESETPDETLFTETTSEALITEDGEYIVIE